MIKTTKKDLPTLIEIINKVVSQLEAEIKP